MRTLCFIIISIVLGTSTATAASKYVIAKTIQYSFTLHNRTNRVIDTAEFWTYAPVKLTSNQRFMGLTISCPYQIVEDEEGNQMLHFTFKEFPPYGQKIITIKADMLIAREPNRIAVSKRLRKTHLLPERYVESDDPSIVRLARQMKGKDPRRTIENIFQWVTGNISYSGYTQNDRGALYALNNRKGDCTEFMYLFVALCRANAIPARCVGGYICKEDKILKPVEYHNWPEYYLNKNWLVADPQNKVFGRETSNYIAMHIMNDREDNQKNSFHRFKCSGEGLEAEMNN